jgi:hypothetical protein
MNQPIEKAPTLSGSEAAGNDLAMALEHRRNLARCHYYVTGVETRGRPKRDLVGYLDVAVETNLILTRRGLFSR